MVARGVRGCSGGCMVAWGACVVALGGHAWFFLRGVHGYFLGGHVCFFLGGMHGFSGGCCAWFFLGGGMHGFFWGVCMVFSGGACIRYDKIRSMSGQYASYWNAFLLGFKILTTNVKVYFTVFLLNTVCCLFSRKIC